MSNKHLSLKPQCFDPCFWYYEEAKGLKLYHEINNGGKYLRIDQVFIPWRMVRESLERKDRTKK